MKKGHFILAFVIGLFTFSGLSMAKMHQYKHSYQKYQAMQNGDEAYAEGNTCLWGTWDDTKSEE